MKRVCIIGGGAAGCFCAIHLKRQAEETEVHLFEAHQKLLAKVAITGGGRCNLTNSFALIRSLQEAYPRGERVMQRALKAFSPQDTQDWFSAEGLPLVLQEDQCIFPASQRALDVVRLLEKDLGEAGVTVHTDCKVERIEPGFRVFHSGGEIRADALVVTTGGLSRKGAGDFLSPLALEMVPPVPSLFTFTVADEGLRALAGAVVQASLAIPGTSFKASGPLLVTDWGLSGPATLKLSSYAARYLAEHDYQAPLCIQWMEESPFRLYLERMRTEHPRKLVTSVAPHPLPQRLWAFLCERAGLRPGLCWGEMGDKGRNRLTSRLVSDNYTIAGKSRFREEFVTCGGVALSNINLSTLECKKHPGLYFAGEVLDIDAITGGFNLQAAWSTGYLAALSIAAK